MKPKLFCSISNAAWSTLRGLPGANSASPISSKIRTIISFLNFLSFENDRAFVKVLSNPSDVQNSEH